MARLTRALLIDTDWIHSNSCTNAQRPIRRQFENDAKRR